MVRGPHRGDAPLRAGDRAKPVRARARWLQLGLGVAIVLCNLASFAFAARATGTVMSLEAILTLIPLILTAMLIPATSPAGGFGGGGGGAVPVGIPASAGPGLPRACLRARDAGGRACPACWC